MRDGYAVRAADLLPLPATLEVIGEIKAGARIEDIPPLQPGQAAAIMTGAPAPPGADAVVMVEYTSRDAGRVRITKPVAAGDNIAPVASEAKRGEKLLSPGARLDFAAIAVAASVGRSRLLVYSKPKVAILSTGDEIVDIDVPLRPPKSATPIRIRWPRRCRLPAESPSCCQSLLTNPNACVNSSPKASNPICCCSPAESRWASTTWSNKSWRSSRQSSFSPEPKSNRESR